MAYTLQEGCSYASQLPHLPVQCPPIPLCVQACQMLISMGFRVEGLGGSTVPAVTEKQASLDMHGCYAIAPTPTISGPFSMVADLPGLVGLQHGDMHCAGVAGIVTQCSSGS